MKIGFCAFVIISIFILQTTIYPQFWVYQVSGTSQHLNGVHMLNEQMGWVCGNVGVLLRTSNGGQNWTQVSITFKNLNSLVFKDDNVGIAVGDSGVIIRTTNGGVNWSHATSGTTGQFRKVSSGAGSMLFAAGDNGLAAVSTDNGATWNLKNSGTILRFRGATAAGLNKVWAVGENGLIKYSSDGGNNWANQNSGITNAELQDIQFINESVGFSGGNGSNFIFTNDGGQTWTSRNSGIFANLYGIYFQDANIGWAVSIVGTIFFTTNGGISWTSQPCGSAFTLREAYFLHQGRGWTVGDNGTIVMYDNPGLPVELTSLSASVMGSNVSLSWNTAAEKNNKGFEIERKDLDQQFSVSHSEYKTIGFVEGNGTTTKTTDYSFLDKNLAHGVYNYRIKQIDFNGGFEYYKLSSDVVIETPGNFSLSQNYPNPFNPSTVIKFTIPSYEKVTLKIYDIIGNEVATLVDENKEAASYEIEFIAQNLSSGIYLFTLQAGSFVQSKKMTLLQ